MRRIKIIVADRREIFRRGMVDILRGVPEIEILTTCESGYETIEKTKELKPDVILLDADITKCDCIEASQSIHNLRPNTRIIILTYSFESKNVLPVFNKAGARGYVSKAISGRGLIESITSVDKGRVFISPLLAAMLIDELALLDGSMVAEKANEVEHNPVLASGYAY
ncbi:response regulator transcription factor [Chloroflexota bacterium]